MRSKPKLAGRASNTFRMAGADIAHRDELDLNI
jgi:hypothetical protein